MGIEPTLSAWEAEVLPLNYIRAGYIITHFRADVKGWEEKKLLSPLPSHHLRQTARPYVRFGKILLRREFSVLVVLMAVRL